MWALYSLAYVVNIAAIREGGIGADNLQHMWSLSQEEQFYLVWPVALVLVLRRGARPRTLAVLLGAAGIFLILYRAALEAVGAEVWIPLVLP